MAAKIGKNKLKTTSKTVKKTVKLKKPSKAIKIPKKAQVTSQSKTNIKPKTKIKSKVIGKTKVKTHAKPIKTLSKPVKSKKHSPSKKVVKKITTKISQKAIKHIPVTKQTTKVAVKEKKSLPKHESHNHVHVSIKEAKSPHNHPKIKETSSHIKHHDANETSHLDHDAALSGPSKFQPYRIISTEDYMNEQQLEHFANILEAWKQELMIEVDNTITEMKEADILADPNDRATQEETFNLELRTRDRERKLIKKIEAALIKITEQKYGYCDSCGVEIGVRRLEARPTATLCIECKTLAEIREKRA